MTPDGVIDTSASSRTEFSGVMVIDAVTANPGKPKSLCIMGAFYTTAGPMMGVFRYFNKYDHTIEQGTRWFINTTVALFDVTAVSKAGFMVDSPDEFDLMGDIFYLFPANDAPAKNPPIVRVCGRPSNIIPETASFDIDAHQWIGFQGQKVLFPWSGTIPEGWSNKPVPNSNSIKFVSVTGVLAGMRASETSWRFHVDIISVTFLGPAPPAYTTQAITPTPKGKRKLGICFEDRSTPTKKARN